MAGNIMNTHNIELFAHVPKMCVLSFSYWYNQVVVNLLSGNMCQACNWHVKIIAETPGQPHHWLDRLSSDILLVSCFHVLCTVAAKQFRNSLKRLTDYFMPQMAYVPFRSNLIRNLILDGGAWLIRLFQNAPAYPQPQKDTRNNAAIWLEVEHILLVKLSKGIIQ